MNEGRTAPAQSTSPAPAKAGAGRFTWLRLLSGILLPGMFVMTVVLAAHEYGSGFEVGAAQARATPASSLLYRDGPPLGFSGGFGEDHCQACHSDDKLNASPGSLTISAPERYSPGKTYSVTLTLRRRGMAIGGFQLTSRFEEDSAQAGTLALVDGQKDRMKVVTDRGVQYAYHTREGTPLTSTDVVRWTISWTAPTGSRAVLFHAAANAANGDESQSGDFIYTSRVRSRGR
jgi:hypothetical protein